MYYEKSIDIYGDGIGRVDYVNHMGDDLTVVNSARVSFGVEKEELDGRDRKLINYLIKHRHTSTLEHNLITFRFTVPMYVRSQHHRHRTWSYNEISRRYTDVNIKFYEPKGIQNTTQEQPTGKQHAEELIDPQIELFSRGIAIAIQWLKIRCIDENVFPQPCSLYVVLIRMIDAGVCREQARGVLPQNLYTEYYGTVNLSNLLKFIDLRTHEGAQWEIQKVAEACLEIATDLFPVTVGAYRRIRNEE